MAQSVFAPKYVGQSPFKHGSNRQALPLRVYSFAQAISGKLNDRLQRQELTLGTLRGSVLHRSLFRQLAFPHLSGTKALAGPYITSIDTIVKQEVRTNLENLSGLRDSQAQAIGLLVSKAQLGMAKPAFAPEVIYITDLLRTAANHAGQPYSIEQNSAFKEPEGGQIRSPHEVAQQLIAISYSFDKEQASFNHEFTKYSAPNRIIRYWPIAVLGYSGLSFGLRCYSSRKDEMIMSYEALVDTASAFWKNWILDPFRKILATIRHDEGSEVALLSSRSLSTDLDSLERMVVDFARDNPQFLQTDSLEMLKSSARNGDLTSVLIAYEKSIKNPLRSAIGGSLIRALLIQIQKTKVDVEVAINGIDKLLKSQELVFGFVSVSPALVVVWLASQWMTRVLRKEKRGRRNLRLSSIKTLRNVDRLLCPGDEQEMTYKRRGLVLCEAQLLRKYSTCIGADLRHQYLEDIMDLERASNLPQTRHVMARIFRIYGGSLVYN